MSGLRNLPVGTKIISMVVVTIAMFLVCFTIIYNQIVSIGNEIEGIAERDMPLVTNITKIESTQLEQAIHFERILRFSDPDSSNKAQLAKEIKKFRELGKTVDEELVHAEHMLQKDLNIPDLPDADRKEFEKLLKQIKTLEKEHAEYAVHVEELIKLGNSSQSTDLINKIIKEEEEIIKEVHSVLVEIETFTQNALLIAEEHEHFAEKIILWGSILTSILSLAAGYLIGKGISNPIKSMTDVMGELSNDNMSVEIPHTEQKDEIGQMAKAVKFFKDQLLKVRELEREQEEQKKRVEEQRKVAMNQLADSFEENVGKVLKTVTSAATELQESSNQMASNASQTSSQSTAVATAAEEASANVQTVAAATEELSGSITEISQQVTRSTDVAFKAQEEASSTTQSIRSLSEQVSKISEIVSLITDIADQTNLLALNATIEAARAGDAGKGFAVVASEVKNLANQTAGATEEIGSQITAIQVRTEDAVNAIASISEVINEMSEISSSVASAVEEQTAATSEISQSVDQAAVGTGEVSKNIASVEQAAQETGVAANQIKSSSGELTEQAEILGGEVSRFLDQVRSEKDDMKLMDWDENLESGDASIDRHHKEQIDELNNLYREMMNGNGHTAALELVRSIEENMIVHIIEEEEYMQSIGYPQLEGHKNSHKEFMNKFDSLKQIVLDGDPSGTADLFNYVSSWLKDHINNHDKKAFEFAQNNNAVSTAAE